MPQDAGRLEPSAPSGVAAPAVQEHESNSLGMPPPRGALGVYDGAGASGSEAAAESSPAPPIDTESALPKGHVLEVRLWNVDDREEVYLNGTLVASANYARDSGWLDLTAQAHPGTNTIRFQLMNRGGGYTYGFAARMDGVRFYEDEAGQAGRAGADHNSHRTGVIVDLSREFVLLP